MIGVVADLPHYRRHLTPIIDGLGEAGIEVSEGAGDLTLVAGRADARRVDGPVVLVEHGAGQLYWDGGRLIDAYGDPTPESNVVLYLAPRPAVIDTMRRVVPNAAIVVTGTPAVDSLEAGGGDRIVFATHWPSGLGSKIPEAGTSWPWSLRHVEALFARFGDRVTVHAHPRFQARVRNDLARRRLGIRVETDWHEVAATAQILVVDNSSIVWEAQRVGIPVVLFDHPTWRLEPGHDLRWSEGLGLPLVRDSTDLVGMVEAELANPRRAVDVYPTGQATPRAVSAVLRCL